MNSKGHVLLMELLDCIYALDDAESDLKEENKAKILALGGTEEELNATYQAAVSTRTDKMIEIEGLLNKALNTIEVVTQ